MNELEIVRRIKDRVLDKATGKARTEIEVEIGRIEEEASMRVDLQACTDCALAEGCANKVPGVGPMSTDIMFVGEAPAEVETHTGVPFTGPSGQLMNKALEAVGIDRTQYYFTNVVKCRTPDNRTPLISEVKACYKHLKREIDYVNPKVIVCLGGTAASTLIHPDFKVTQEHSSWFEMNGRRAIAVFHPAYLLYLQDGSERQNRAKWDVFNGLKKVKEYRDSGFRDVLG
jgi:DNA polymerase